MRSDSSVGGPNLCSRSDELFATTVSHSKSSHHLLEVGLQRKYERSIEMVVDGIFAEEIPLVDLQAFCLYCDFVYRNLRLVGERQT